MRTSATDTDSYRKAVQRFLDDEEAFQRFRSSDPDYNRVLEHATMEIGERALDLIIPKIKDNDSWMMAAQRNDSVGAPKKYDYGQYKSWSPTTLMYMKVLSDLEKYFDINEVTSFAEIGGGYGGQCALIKEYYGITDYAMLDLPEVVRLQKKYLTALGLGGVRYDVHPYTVPLSDIVISSFAFDELVPEWQMMCFNHIIKRAKGGIISGRWFDGGNYQPKDMIQAGMLDPKFYVIEPFEPHTGIDCYTLIWRK